MKTELIAKAKLCKNKEELLKLAKENDFELSEQEAELYLQDFKEGEVADAELDNVAGGQEGCADPPRPHDMQYWYRKEDVQYIFKVGDVVQAFPEFCCHHTCTVIVKELNVSFLQKTQQYCDVYWCEKKPGERAPFMSRWCKRIDIEE